MTDTNNTTGTIPKEPSISDLFTLMQATRNDIEAMKNDVFTYTTTTNSKFEGVHERVDNVEEYSGENRERIEKLEATVEILKQEQLRNNICISGVPIEKK